MPTFEGSAGRVYYRDWEAPEAVAGIVFGHGYGEHSGLFHRFAFALGQSGIRVWGIDAIGHGLSEGTRGVAAVGDLASNVLTLAEIAQNVAPGLPLVVAGHSMGSIAATVALVRNPQAFKAAVLTGSPIDGFDRSVLNELDGVVMSRDAFYLDQLEHDPLEAWIKDAPPPSPEALDADAEIWGTLSELPHPILFINGEEDPIAPPAMARRAAKRCQNASIVEIAGGCHDIINDAPHALVAEHVTKFVLAATQ